MKAEDIIRHANGDILRNADGTPVEGTEVIDNAAVVEPTTKKFSLASTTDKMGITTAGQLSRAFFWGLGIGVIGMFALGYWKDKISITYTK